MAVVLVTGCSSGLGEAIALAFAGRGDSVVATMRTPETAPSGLQDAANIEIAPLDVTDPRSRQNALEAARTRYGRIDVLVNNAGIAYFASIEDASEAVVRQVFETNFFGPLALMQAILPTMREQGSGRIVNVTAIGAIFSTPLLGIYSAAKHALDAASAALDIEGRAFGVRAPSVLPHLFKTSIGETSPAPVVSETYGAIAESMARARAAGAADVKTDLRPVADAVVAAATEADPKPRYVVGAGIALELGASVSELERLHHIDLVRAGF